MDVDDWLKLPDSGERIELIDGSFVVSPAAMGLHALCAGGLRTVPASEVAAVAEVVSPGPGNHRRDYEVKPLKYAAAGIPVFMRVELEGTGIPRVEVLELGTGGYEVTARAGAGEKLTISDPFAVSFDPADLLDA